MIQKHRSFRSRTSFARRTAGAGAFAALALLVTTPTVAGASSAGWSAQWGDEALRADAKTISEAQGVSGVVTVEHLKQQERILSMLHMVDSLAAETLAGKWIEWRPEPVLVIALVDASARFAIEESLGEIPIDIRVGAKHTLVALLGAIEVIDSQALIPYGIRAGAYVSEPANEIVIELEGDALDSESMRGLDSLIKGVGVPVKIESADGAVQLESAGGRQLSTCTSAFAVTKGSLQGFLTAGHCDNPQQWLNWSTGTWHSTNFQSRAWTSTRDVQWHSISSVTSSFFISKTTQRGQIGTLAVTTGANVCKWGTRSLVYGCGTVTSTTYKPAKCGQSGGACATSWVRVGLGTVKTCMGDSGGPWFIGNYAVGIHVGGGPTLLNATCTFGHERWAYFGTIGGALATMNVSLKTP